MQQLPSEPAQVRSLLQHDDYESAARALRHALELVFGYQYPNDVVSGVVRRFTPDLFAVARRFVSAESSARHFLEALRTGPLREKDRVNLLRLYRRRLKHILPRANMPVASDRGTSLRQHVDELTNEEWVSLLNIALSPSNPLRATVNDELDAIQAAMDRVVTGRLRGAVEQLTSAKKKAEERMCQLDKEIKLVAEQLDECERPKIARILRKENWGQRRELAWSAVSRAAAVARGTVPTVLKAVETALKVSDSVRGQ